jgi:hypothetical protein
MFSLHFSQIWPVENVVLPGLARNAGYDSRMARLRRTIPLLSLRKNVKRRVENSDSGFLPLNRGAILCLKASNPQSAAAFVQDCGLRVRET